MLFLTVLLFVNKQAEIVSAESDATGIRSFVQDDPVLQLTSKTPQKYLPTTLSPVISF